MDQDVMNWWLEFEEKKPEETVIDTFESEIEFAMWFYIIASIFMILWITILIPILF
jgi:hypothetical protein